MKGLALFVIGLVFGATGAVVFAATGRDGHDHAGHDDAGHDHSETVIWGTAPEPVIALDLTPDSVSGQNLEITLSDFAFTPEAVGDTDTPGGGHAHVYVNGHKVGRVYGDWVHLPDATSGDVVRVTLNANSHAVWIGTGGPLAAEVTVP